MNESIHRKKPSPFRNRTKPIKKWRRNEEIALIKFLKQNPDFEKPNSRIYYNKFLDEIVMDADWNNVRSKVRNMRTTYRKAKEYEVKSGESIDLDYNAESVRIETLKICWYVDDFDLIFPNEMDNYIHIKPQVPSIYDEFSNQESSSNINNSNRIFNAKCMPDELTSSSSSISMDGDIFTVQKNLFNLKRQKRVKDTTIKQQELELAREKLNFEKEKFRQEFKLKEKELETQERLKIMELQMKERVAIKELELKEKLALKSMEKQEVSYNNVYHDMQ